MDLLKVGVNVKIDVTTYLGTLASDVIFQTRTLELHSRMQQLTAEQHAIIRTELRQASDRVLEFIEANTKPPMA